MIIEDLTTTGIVAIVQKVSEQATQEVLVRRAREHPNAPPLSWRHQRRLKKLVRTERAVAAMFEQDDLGVATLSYEIALHVFEEQESQRSQTLAHTLIAEVAGCLPASQRDGLLAYRLRVIKEAVDDVGEDVREVGSGVREVSQNVSDLRQFLTDRVINLQLNPEVLIAGPLRALGLEEEYAAIQSLEATDPTAAAARLSNVISRIADNGHREESLPFVKQRAQLLTRAGDVNAADAWLPLVKDFLSSGRGVGLHEPVQAWKTLVNGGNAPAWLGARIAIADALESWLYGDVDASNLLALAIAAIAAGDPEGTTWLVYAVESCLADRREASIADARDDLVAAANSSHDIGLSARLLLAVADATGNEELWQQMLAEAEPAGGRYPTDLSGLIHARRARSAFWAGRLDEALAEFRLATDCGARDRIWDDAADWASSAVHVMHLGDRIILGDLQALQEREQAFRAAGGGSLLSQADDLHLTALTYLVETEGGGGPVRRAWSALARYRRRTLVLGAVNQEIESHGLTGRLHLQLGDSDMAIGHFIKAGDLDQAARVAEKLTRFHDCREDVSALPHRQRAVALRVAAEEADLIPDDQVLQWAQTALSEAKKREFTLLGPDTDVNSYKLLQGLATRFPTTLVDELPVRPASDRRGRWPGWVGSLRWAAG